MLKLKLAAVDWSAKFKNHSDIVLGIFLLMPPLCMLGFLCDTTIRFRLQN